MKRVLMTCFYIVAASAASSAQTFYFPQVAIGGYEAGYWQTTIFLSNAKPDTASGTVTSNSLAVLGNAVFTNWDLAGNLVAEAGVPMAIPLPKQGIFIDTTSGFKTGVAIGNPNTLRFTSILRW